MLQVTLNLDEKQTKELFKQAISEMLEQKNEALYDALAEVLEDIALVRAIQEGELSVNVSRAEVFEVLKGAA
jgi:vacuolar-type H+-ATPase subunit D/Vma8